MDQKRRNQLIKKRERLQRELQKIKPEFVAALEEAGVPHHFLAHDDKNTIDLDRLFEGVAVIDADGAPLRQNVVSHWEDGFALEEKLVSIVSERGLQGQVLVVWELATLGDLYIDVGDLVRHVSLFSEEALCGFILISTKSRWVLQFHHEGDIGFLKL